MKRSGRLPELLSPAGDFECLVAAIEAGADAVYVGGKSYSARAYAKNFDLDELRRAARYCHLHGAKLYVTLNTLLYNEEISGAVDFARDLYRIGIDALIVADLGLVSILREAVPNLELHASTQMSVHNSLGADVAYSEGCKRVVLARELSREDMARVTEKCLAEVEVFLHGALCVCHSGQCLFSSLVGGRSGNRGECAQPCRLPYNGGGYPLSLRDLSLAGHIPELIDMGVASLKIEGRMKSPDYVYTVTSIYRRLLDENRRATDEEARELMSAFSRGGFTDAYFEGHPERRSMLGVRSEEDKAETRSREELSFSPKKIRAWARVSIKAGERATMTLYTADKEASATGDIPREAISSPLSGADVKARLSKMGNTFLELSVDDIELSLDDGLNLSPGSLNALRRAAADAFEGADRELELIEIPKIPENVTRGKGKSPRTALFYRISAFNKYSDEGFFDISFIPLWLTGEPECRRVPNGVAMPPVIMESEIETVKRLLRGAHERGAKYALIENLGQISMAVEAGLIPIGDFRLNVMNSYTRAEISRLGIDDVILSPELTARESADIGGRGIVYGRVPLMLTERCFMRDMYGCRSCSEVGLTDRRGVEFPMVREFEHRNLIFNSAVTYIADKPKDIASFVGEHFIFSTEDSGEIGATVKAYKAGLAPAKGLLFRRIGKREFKK